VTTTQLLIVCLTALVALTIAAVAVLKLATAANAARLSLSREHAALERFNAERDAAAARGEAVAAKAPPMIGHRVTVHTKKPDDQTFYGVLIAEYADRILLEDAEYVTPTGPVPMQGTQRIAQADIAWIDVHALVADVTPAAPAEPEPA
jgi:hypothetical protein